jgi:hypothetical protein
MAAALSIQQNCSRFGFTIGSPAANGRETGKMAKCAAIMKVFRGNSDAV